MRTGLRAFRTERIFINKWNANSYYNGNAIVMHHCMRWFTVHVIREKKTLNTYKVRDRRFRVAELEKQFDPNFFLEFLFFAFYVYAATQLRLSLMLHITFIVLTATTCVRHPIEKLSKEFLCSARSLCRMQNTKNEFDKTKCEIVIVADCRLPNTKYQTKAEQIL